MKILSFTSGALLSVSSAAVLAGNGGQLPLGAPVPSLGATQAPLSASVPALGEVIAPLGADMSLPMMAVIGALGLIAGIRYIRNKRS